MSETFEQRYAKKRAAQLKNPVFVTRLTTTEINEELCRVMEAAGITRAELAEKMGVHRQFVTKMLNGNSNVTLLTLIKAVLAMDAELSFSIKPMKANTAQCDDSEWNVIPFPKAHGHGEAAISCSLSAQEALWRTG